MNKQRYEDAKLLKAVEQLPQRSLASCFEVHTGHHHGP